MPARPPQYSPKQVADSLQVSESSVKRWCDRGTIPTVRTVGGHRRITLEGLRAFLCETNRSLVDPSVLGLPQLARRRTFVIPGAAHPDQKRFREALAAGDEATCRKIVVARRADGWTRSETAEYLVTDAMKGIGDAWEENTIDVYQERVGCGICVRLINELSADVPKLSPDAPVAVGGAPSGDPYELPTALIELTLRESGWRAINLGSNLPMQSFVQAAHDHEAAMVWLSASVIEDDSMFIAAQNHLANSLDENAVLVVGGRALCDKIRPKLLYTAHCDSLHHLVEFGTMMRENSAR